MITFSRLGDYGWLGNQMFQYAALVGIKKNLEYFYDEVVDIGIPRHYGYQLTECFNLSAKDIEAIPERKVQERTFAFDPLVMHTKDDSDVLGYLQSETYFAHCLPAISAEFKFRNEITQAATREYARHVSNGRPLVAVHIRRGNYLLKPNYHTNLGMGYYTSALMEMKRILGRFDILVFSDDIEWCKENFGTKIGDVSVKYAEYDGPLASEYVDLCTMSMCDHFIIANSSFSWWGAWLGERRHWDYNELTTIVIAPKDWFGPDGPQDTQDLIPARWVRL